MQLGSFKPANFHADMLIYSTLGLRPKNYLNF